MAFDWIGFLDQYRIEYILSGPNVAQGNVGIRCPFCPDDPSFHMGISLAGHGYNCWRRAEHGGKNPVRLIRALLGCTTEQAQAIVGGPFIPSDFMSRVSAAVNPKLLETESKPLTMPPEFKPIGKMPSARPYRRYLYYDRGFLPSQINTFTEHYDLRYCTKGPYKGRIIFPVYHERQLVSWTGRSIFKNADLRYKALTTKPEKAEREGTQLAVAPINRYLLWYDELMREDCGETVYITEGPFDALKVRVLGRKYGIAATCVFTNRVTDEQIELLHQLLPRFSRRYLLLDQGMLGGAMTLANRLSSLGLIVKQLPKGVKDPGLLTRSQLLKLNA